MPPKPIQPSHAAPLLPRQGMAHPRGRGFPQQGSAAVVKAEPAAREASPGHRHGGSTTTSSASTSSSSAAFTPPKRMLAARPALPRSWAYSQAPSTDSNEPLCMLNHQRELALPRPTAAPTATQLRVCLTLQFSVAAGAALKSHPDHGPSQQNCVLVSAAPALNRILVHACWLYRSASRS